MDKLEAAKELQKMIDLLPERLDITERRRKEALEIAIKELKHMLKGIDVSEHNGIVNWNKVKNAGMDFAIIRLGFGNKHLDGSFYDNYNGAKMAGLKVGVYYYSYAMTPEEAKSHRPKVVLTDGENKITKVTSYEKHGLLTEML